MADVKTVIAFFLRVLVLLISISYVGSYNLTCPTQGNWKTRAKIKCTSISKYFCLYNDVERVYVEGCTGPDWDRKGSRRIFSGGFTRGNCLQTRYQPYRFETNGSMSDCIYAKTMCNEEGQIICKDSSTKDDRTCRCDNKKNYAFIKSPKHFCYCIPTEEDCSCHIKSCSLNLTLSLDYDCLQNGHLKNQRCIDYKQYEPVTETTPVQLQVTTLSSSQTTSTLSWRTTLPMLCSLGVILIIAGFFFAVLFHKWTRKKIYTVKCYFEKNDTGMNKQIAAGEDDVASGKKIAVDESVPGPCEGTSVVKKTPSINKQIASEEDEVVTGKKIAVDESVPGPCEGTSVVKKTPSRLTADEVNFLRIIHLLFRVAGPVVRMKFNHEIKPNKLQSTLSIYKRKMTKQYRGKDKIINDHQWDKLYKKFEGETVTSDEFDIRLMIKLLDTLPGSTIGDKYPETADTSDNAMLSRIKFIRNETTRKLKGKLQEDQFNQYWDDIGQAVLKLVSSHKLCLDNDTEKVKLIGRLLDLNPIHIDDTKLREFIEKSKIYPGLILQQLISEYCNSNNVTIENILMANKHILYHKRIKTNACCECDKPCNKYEQDITEEQWNTLYQMRNYSDSHNCTIKNCSESFVPKRIITSDLSTAKILILKVQSIHTFMMRRVFDYTYNDFLTHNQHKLYHFMEKKRCCKCKKNLSKMTERTLINKKKWNQLFIKTDKFCQTGSKECCCQYSVRQGIKYKNMDDTFLSDLFNIAGPFGVLNQIKQDEFLYFLNWTVGEQDLRKALTELLNIIEDETFRKNMSRQTLFFTRSQSNEIEATKGDACDWVSSKVRSSQATKEPPLQIYVLEKDGLNVKGVNIPKDFSLHQRKRKFTDISTEENNFLLIVLGLTKIVYPLIENEFNRHCTRDVLDKLHEEIYTKLNEQFFEDNVVCGDTMMKKRIHLTQNEQHQLFHSSDEVVSKDLKLMIKILKRRFGELGKTDCLSQVNEIESITREIVQSSSGVLNERKFRETMQSMKQAVVCLRREFDEEELFNFQHIQNILEYSQKEHDKNT